MDNRPTLPEYLQFFVSAFSRLSGRRQYGMAANPISVTDIVSYLTLYPWHDPEQFFTYICHLDNLYLADRAKKDEAKQKASASKAKTKGK